MAAQSLVGQTAAVRAVGVTRRFGGRTVLRDVDLDIGADEFVVLLGPSGTGKSTLLKILAGLDRLVEGRVHVPDRRAVIFQDPRLLPWARVLDNVVLGLRGSDAKQRGRSALAEVGLDGHERDWPKTLSGGEAQRVALARALVRDPELLLLDEPFGALDALTRIRMHNLLRGLCERYRPAVLLVTHDVDEAIVLADRVVVLAEGRIVLDVVGLERNDRRRDVAEFANLRNRLLGALGVADDSVRPPTASLSS